MRLFFAVTLPEEIIERVSVVQEEFRAVAGQEGIRWTRPDQFHYTLKFLGEIIKERSHKAVETAIELGKRIQPFDLTLGGLGAFPNMERPSVLWIGATEGVEAMTDFAGHLNKSLTQHHFSLEKKPFNAHLTLARIQSYRGEAAAARILKSKQIGEMGTFQVSHFVLMQSDPQPSGAVYSIIEEFKLGVQG